MFMGLEVGSFHPDPKLDRERWPQGTGKLILWRCETGGDVREE